MIAAHTPDLHEVLATGQNAGWAFVALDGPLIHSIRTGERSPAGQDL